MIWEARRTLLWLVTLFSILTIFHQLDQGFLPSYDDAYYAQKAREIIQTGDIWTMRIDGRPRFDNPPGFMWLIAASYKAFGVSEFSARFPSALGGVLGILGTFLLFELLFGTRIGFLAALVLNLTTVYLKYSRHSMMDATVAASVVWSFYFFLRGVRGSQWWFVVAGAVASYIFFAKSVFGGLPVLALLTYLMVTREWRTFTRPALWLGALLAIAPYAVWALIEYQRFGREFVDGHFVKLILHSSANRGPNDYWYDYIVVLLKYFPLFLPFMMIGIWKALRAQGEESRRALWFVLTYFGVFFVLLSLQATKKTWYFLPALPACAGLAAVGLETVVRRFSTAQLGRAMAVLFVATFLGLMTMPISLSIPRAVEIRSLAPYVRAAAAQGFEVLGYEIDYFGLNSSLLFYSDSAARPVGSRELAQALESANKVALVVSPERWSQVRQEFPNLSVIRQTGKLILVGNAPLEQKEVF